MDFENISKKIIIQDTSSANLGLRILAFVIDLFIVGVLLILAINLLQLVGIVSESFTGSREQFLDQFVWAVVFISFNFFLLIKYRQSLGKKLLKIKVDINNNNVYMKLFARETIKTLLIILVVLTGNVFFMLLFVINIILPIFPGRLALHDLITNTRVIKSDI